MRAALSSGIGQADIRAIPYETGEPFIEDICLDKPTLATVPPHLFALTTGPAKIEGRQAKN